MGKWVRYRAGTTERERWVADFHGDVPRDEAGRELLHPCATCWGEFHRFTVKVRDPKTRARVPTDPPQYRFAVACYRGPHGWAEDRDAPPPPSNGKRPPMYGKAPDPIGDTMAAVAGQYLRRERVGVLDD